MSGQNLVCTCENIDLSCHYKLLRCKHTERQRPMLVYGDAWEWVWDHRLAFAADTAAAADGAVNPRCGYTLRINEQQFINELMDMVFSDAKIKELHMTVWKVS